MLTKEMLSEALFNFTHVLLLALHDLSKTNRGLTRQSMRDALNAFSPGAHPDEVNFFVEGGIAALLENGLATFHGDVLHYRAPAGIAN